MKTPITDAFMLTVPSGYARHCCEFARRLELDRAALMLAAADMLSGWRYIRETHGDLYGVGWDRAQKAVESALAAARANFP